MMNPATGEETNERNRDGRKSTIDLGESHFRDFKSALKGLPDQREKRAALAASGLDRCNPTRDKPRMTTLRTHIEDP